MDAHSIDYHPQQPGYAKRELPSRWQKMALPTAEAIGLHITKRTTAII